MTWIVPILHPAYILRGKWGLAPCQIHFLQLAKEISTAGYEKLDINIPPDGSILDPSISDIKGWIEGIGDDGITVDIENPGGVLMCIGFCRMVDMSPIVIRFVMQGHIPRWETVEEETEARQLCIKLLTTYPTCYHNGQSFDIPELCEYLHEHWKYELYEMGLGDDDAFLNAMLKVFAFDTLLAHFVMYPEMPKGLEFLSWVYARIPRWKHLTKGGGSEPEGEGKE